MYTNDDEVCRLRNMFCKIKYIVFKIKILTVLLLSRSFGKDELMIIKDQLVLFYKVKINCQLILFISKNFAAFRNSRSGAIRKTSS